MTLSLYAPTSYSLGLAGPFEETGTRHRPTKVYKGYFVVEELVGLPAHSKLKQGK